MPGRRARTGWRRLAVAVVLVPAGVVAAWAASWADLAKDDIHDPASPAIRMLQQPAEALAALPRDGAGNKVDWMRALDQGLIKPRSSVEATFQVRHRNTEILMRNTSTAHMVRFPHRQHTAWIDCISCHDGLFEMRAGTTRVNMLMILSGEKCGRCHGAVAFPLTECQRCHAVARGSEAEKAFGGKLVREVRSP